MIRKQVTIADGRTVEVDAARWAAFDSVRPDLMARFSDGSPQSARDSNEALAFIVSQLAYTEAQIFERLYIPMQYEELLPITNEAGEWADTIRYEIYDYSGQGKRASGKGRDINLVDVAYSDKAFAVCNGNIGYDYTTEELRRTAFLRRPISERKLAAAMDGYRRHMNQVGLYGEPSANVTGLFNNVNVPHGNAPNGGWVAGYTSDITYVTKIMADINTLITTIWTSTAYNDLITDIIMPPTLLAFLASTPRSINSDTTILSYVKANNIAKTERGIDIKFSAGYGLDTASLTQGTRMVGYVKSDTRLVMHIPLPLRFLAPQLVGLSVVIPGEYKYSGVEVRYPLSAYYMDNM